MIRYDDAKAYSNQVPPTDYHYGSEMLEKFNKLNDFCECY